MATLKKSIAAAVVAMSLLLTALSSNVFATAQMPDYIFYKGVMVKYPIAGGIMEYFFQKYPKKRPQPLSTALYRGHIATFSIIQNELWVVDIEVPSIENLLGVRSEMKSIINDVLDAEGEIKIDWLSGSLPIPHIRKADWFSGLLIVPQGKIFRGREYELYAIVEIKNGNCVMEAVLNREQYDKFGWIPLMVNFPAPYFRMNHKRIFEILSDAAMPKELLDYFIREYEIDKW